MNDRDDKGRFTFNNKISKLGFQGLVNKRFNGDGKAAKRWLADLGMWAYDQALPTWMRNFHEKPVIEDYQGGKHGHSDSRLQF